MSALIWDSTSQAFKDADTPKIYSGSSFGDAEGKIWNETAQAWEDAWNSWNGELYDQGNEYIGVTGGIVQGSYTTYPGQLIKNADSITLRWGSGYASVAITNNMIDITDYNYLCADVISLPSESYFALAVSLSKSIVDADIDFTTRIFTTGTIKRNISSLTGSYYLSAFNGGTFNKMWLE